MDLGCPLLLGSSVRRLRRRAATPAVENRQPNFQKPLEFEVLKATSLFSFERD